MKLNQEFFGCEPDVLNTMLHINNILIMHLMCASVLPPTCGGVCGGGTTP